MAEKTDIHRKLAGYVYSDLEPEEARRMGKTISEDPELLESYHLNKMVHGYLKAKVILEDMRSDPDLEEAERLASMAEEEQGVDFSEGERTKRIKPWYGRGSLSGSDKNRVRPAGSGSIRHRLLWAGAAIAAGLAILIAVITLTSKIDPDRLYDRYYEPLAASDYTQRGSMENLYPGITRGIESYINGNYTESIRQFQQMEANPGTRAEADFFTGMSYLGMDRHRQAQAILEDFIDVQTRYLPEALWYLSLSYIKTGDFQKAAVLLKRLEAYDGMYKPDTQALLKKLRRITG